jgi:hypothetical protein
MNKQGFFLPYDLIEKIGCTAAMKLAMFHYQKTPMGRHTLSKLIREGYLLKGEERVTIAPHVIELFAQGKE